MKKFAALLLVMFVASAASFQPAQAEDTAVSKVGKAIVWPFKKVGQGLKAMGNVATKPFKKGS
ncbi:MAG: hypothetical protein K2X93_25470 [Candidatus Obscuribacterales bacterium]|nr:hypothetical protein [Candidatus Obscuribacterales bacterium]